MNALPLVCLCVLTRSAAPAAGHGPEVIKVEQDGDAILPCSLGNRQNMEAGLFHWKKAAQGDERQREVFFYEAGVHYNNGLHGQSHEFTGRVSHFQEELRHGNASIVIRNTKMADGGNYSCAFPRLQTPQTFFVQLVVGAAPKPSITTLKTKDGVLLLCEAHGWPEPAVEWQDGSGLRLPAGEKQVSERGGRFYSSLGITVTRAGSFRCVATQRSINHAVHAETYVPLGGSQPAVTHLEQTKDRAWLRCEVRGAAAGLRVEWEDGSGNRLAAHEPALPVAGGSDDIILNLTVTQTDRYRCVSTDRTNKRSEAETHVYIAGSSGWTSTMVAVAAFLGGVSLVVVVGVVVLVVLIRRGHISLRSRTDSSGNKAAPEETDSLQTNIQADC